MARTMHDDVKHYFKDHAYQNIPLSYAEALELGKVFVWAFPPKQHLHWPMKEPFGDALVWQFQTTAILSALHTRATYAWQWSEEEEREHGHPLPKSAGEQIAGICAAIFERDIPETDYGFLEPDIPYAMDNSGMGGDLTVTANVSTLAALIAAAAGIPMCKHGSPANADEGRHGSSDFIDKLGIMTIADGDLVEKCLMEENFGYTCALNTKHKRIHLQTHRFAKLSHMNDILGPITNPLHPKLLTRRVLGVNHLISPRVVAEAYCALNAHGITNLQHGLFIRGFAEKGSRRGMDELSICEGGTHVAELIGTNIREYHIGADMFGLAPAPPELISPPAGMSKGDFSLKILKGEIVGPPLQMVLANAALLFYLAERSENLEECYAMAQEVHANGATYEKAIAVSKRLPRPAPIVR